MPAACGLFIQNPSIDSLCNVLHVLHDVIESRLHCLQVWQAIETISGILCTKAKQHKPTSQTIAFASRPSWTNIASISKDGLSRTKGTSQWNANTVSFSAQLESPVHHLIMPVSTPILCMRNLSRFLVWPRHEIGRPQQATIAHLY